MNSRREQSVVVVDDDAAVCRSLARALSRHGYKVETFTSPREYLAASDALLPDCLIADMRMPDLDGVSMYEAARAAGRDVPTVFLTGAMDIPMAVAAMRAGACDVLQKPVNLPVLLAAIESATQRAIARRAANDAVAASWEALARLTPREAEVCALVARGRLNKQIAAAIGIAEKTVKVHRARALSKMGVHSVAELVHALDALMAGGTGRPPVDADGHPLPRPAALDAMLRVFDTSNDGNV